MTTIMLTRFRRFLSLILFAALLIPIIPRTVQAAETGYAYRWFLQFDFETGINGQLVVDVGYNNNGAVQNPPLHRQNFVVGCQRVGSMGVIGGVARFTGGYLQCTVDVKSAVEATFANCNAKYPGCMLAIGETAQYHSLKVAADLSSPATGLAPIFAHPSASYAVNLTTSMHTLQSNLAPIGNLNSSAWAVAPSLNTQHHYISRFGCSPLGDCGTHFNVAGNPEYLDSADAPVDFVVSLSTFTIGRDFAGNTIAAGSTLDNLFIDPGNGLPGT